MYSYLSIVTFFICLIKNIIILSAKIIYKNVFSVNFVFNPLILNANYFRFWAGRKIYCHCIDVFFPQSNYSGNKESLKIHKWLYLFKKYVNGLIIEPLVQAFVEMLYNLIILSPKRKFWNIQNHSTWLDIIVVTC